jgi:hypothetical protein
MLFFYLHSVWMSNVYYLDSGKSDYYVASNTAVNNNSAGSMGTMMDDENGGSGNIYNSGLGYNGGRNSASFPISRSQPMMGQDGRIMREP